MLPLIDTHSIAVPQGDRAAWGGIVRLVSERMSSRLGARYASLIGAVPARDSGPRPVELGSTMPGFEVTAFAPGRELALTGSHHFSRYQLVFRVEGGSVVAETHAEFPGALGWAYRLLVIGTRAHRIIVRRLLRSIAREAAAADVP